jgi:hypothetical protein
VEQNESFLDKHIFKIVFGPVVTIFLIYLGGILLAIWPIDSTTVAQSGVFGDSFGVLTALFSGLAFGGVLVALYYQKRDLGLTKQELVDTRYEMRRQHRENNVFQLLRLHCDVVAQLDVKRKVDGTVVDIATGRDSFDRFYEHLKKRYENPKVAKGDVPIEKLRLAYHSFWKDWQKDLGHYFRTLYNIFKFIRDGGFELKEQKLYANIVRAQLSDFELVMLLYNCLTDRGENFKALAKEFALFDNLPVELVFDEALLDPISEAAFGANEAALAIKSSRHEKLSG